MSNQNSISENDSDLKLLCVYAFDNLISVLDKKLKINPIFPEKYKNLKYPLFVSWKKGKEKELRGCIGTFESSDLKTNLYNYSLYAAFNDFRFNPIELKEIPNLNCSISLLVNFENVNDIYDWEIGKHGIEIQFGNNNSYKGTFLPHVAKEQGWDKKKTLESLIMKAGFYGSLNEVKDSIKLTRYQAIKIEMSYEEYLEMKK